MHQMTQSQSDPEQLKREHLQLLKELRQRRMQRCRRFAGRYNASDAEKSKPAKLGQHPELHHHNSTTSNIPVAQILQKQLFINPSDCSECCCSDHDTEDEDDFSTGSVEQLLRKINSQLEADTAALVESTQAATKGVTTSAACDKKVMMRSRRTSAGGDNHRNGYSGTPDFENGVIVKQRKELQLLVSELRERDTELNELVNSHQKQLSNWEADRKRLIVLEEKLRQKDQELQEKNGQLKSAMSRLEESVKQSEERALQVQELQKQQDRLQDESAGLRGTCEELEDTNYQLDRRLRETSAQLVQVETRAGQLEQDVHTAAQNLHQLLHRLKASDASRKELQSQQEEQPTAAEIRKLAGESRDLLRVNEKLQQQSEQLQKDCQLAAERERRKDELVQSQRLKQERTDAELQQLRGMYERMQMDLAALTTNLDTNRDGAAGGGTDGGALLEADLARWTGGSSRGGANGNAPAAPRRQRGLRQVGRRLQTTRRTRILIWEAAVTMATETYRTIHSSSLDKSVLYSKDLRDYASDLA
uniref:Coiled-coil domain-containing protein 62 n=1 Tax=Macrostomum lignano TaxID=282301 RepID=A0A1I8HTX9_9PLAT